MGHDSQTEKDFLAHLREEMLRQQDRRASYVRTKFTFVIALFGLVATLETQRNVQDLLWINAVLYSIPFVAGLFDLYILGGEFAVKRIRAFLAAHDESDTGERRWANFVDTWPKSFMRRNRLLATNFIVLITTALVVVNLVTHDLQTLHWVVFSIWVFLVVLLNVYLYRIEVTIWNALAEIPKKAKVDPP